MSYIAITKSSPKFNALIEKLVAHPEYYLTKWNDLNYGLSLFFRINGVMYEKSGLLFIY